VFITVSTYLPLSAQSLAQTDVISEASLVVVEHILQEQVLLRLDKVGKADVDVLPADSPPIKRSTLDSIGLMNDRVLVTS
jgi:hypothetical protein